MGKTKGSAVLPAVKLLRSRRAKASGLVPPELAHYLEERIVVASWYPEEDLIRLLDVCAEVMPEGGFELMGALGARTHLEGVYADLLHRSAPTRARTLWKTQHDSGVLSVTSETPVSVTYELVDWAHASGAYCRLLGAYFAEAHRLSGAAEPTFEHPACRGASHDRCVWIVRWREATAQ
jgi:hypothetical protein